MEKHTNRPTLLALTTLFAWALSLAGPPTARVVGFGTLAYDLFDGDTGNLLGIVVHVSGTRSR